MKMGTRGPHFHMTPLVSHAQIYLTRVRLGLSEGQWEVLSTKTHASTTPHRLSVAEHVVPHGPWTDYHMAAISGPPLLLHCRICKIR